MAKITLPPAPSQGGGEELTSLVKQVEELKNSQEAIGLSVNGAVAEAKAANKKVDSLTNTTTTMSQTVTNLSDVVDKHSKDKNNPHAITAAKISAATQQELVELETKLNEKIESLKVGGEAIE